MSESCSPLTSWTVNIEHWTDLTSRQCVLPFYCYGATFSFIVCSFRLEVHERSQRVKNDIRQ